MAFEFSLSFIYRILRDSYGALRGRRRSLSDSERLELRDKWKPVFEDRILTVRAKQLRRDVIIRDVARMDDYPEVDKKAKGVSSWFKAGLSDTYHRGIYLGLEWENLHFDPARKKWRWSESKNQDEEKLTAALIGLVRYENIESVDWDGDEYYGLSHIYCHFSEKGGQPCRRLAYFERKEHEGHEWYTELASFDDVKAFSKKCGVSRYA